MFNCHLLAGVRGGGGHAVIKMCGCIYKIESADLEIGFHASTYIYYNILTRMFQRDWLILRITLQPFEIEWSKGECSEVVVHLHV